MMEMGDILANADDQGRGRWFELLDPVTGDATGLKVRIAGPDSSVQATAAALMVDELAEMADLDGRVSGERRAEARRNFLARCCLDWRVTEGGEPIPFTFARVHKLLAVAWVREQINIFAANRAVYAFPEVQDADA